ncbi:amidase [Zhihengliuella sp.]|uniref:amidase n=1 Tax=Zhihengliuella sp. TaxID=1954483 RepID=UPI002810C36F|nr:amidase [Zhihengliuella sp.]
MTQGPRPADTDGVTSLTLRELREALRSGALSAREAAGAFLGRVAQRNPRIGAFTRVTAETALDEAAALDERWVAVRRAGAGDPAGLAPLHGVPAGWKDLWDVAGVPTTYGTAAVPPQTPAGDHPVVAQLRAAGTVSLGKTQIPEFGLNSYSENLVAPPARNPLDPALSAGGSSGGSAAAVAVRMLPAVIGNDGGGSVRIPAAACGLVGLKPGFNTVPADRSALAASDTDAGARDGELYVDGYGAPRLVVSGPIARSAADAGALMDALMGTAVGAAAGPRPGSPVGPPVGAGPFERAALGLEPELERPLRIGVSLTSPFESVYPISVSAPARQALEAGIRALEAAGHRIEEARLRYDPRYPDAFHSVWTSRLADLPLPDGAEQELTGLTYQFRRRALERTEDAKRAASAVLLEIARDLRAQWGRYDAVLTPAMAQTPRPIGYFTGPDPRHADGDLDYRLQCQYTPYTSMVNVSQLPAGVVPSLTTADGLSMGVHLIGRAGAEARLLALMGRIERELA